MGAAVGRPNRRGGSRKTLLLNARCRVSLGNSAEVWLLDLSTTGCRVFGRAGLLRLGQAIMIRPEGLAAQPGTVVWVAGEQAGVHFEQHLHPSVVDHLTSAKPASQPKAAPLDSLVDKFGRRLPRQTARIL